MQCMFLLILLNLPFTQVGFDYRDLCNESDESKDSDR